MPGRLSRILTGAMRLFFRLLYHEFAWSYDLVAWTVSIGRWRSWVLATLPYLTGPVVLELGHGPGHLQAALQNQGIMAIGMDASRQMGRLAIHNLHRAGAIPLLVHGYAQFSPFLAGSFSQVVATFPSEYIFDLQTIAEIDRLLKPGGLAVVLPSAWITGSSFLERLAALLFRLTAQSPEKLDALLISQITAPFRQQGFMVSVRTPEINGSQLLLILAQKPEPDTDLADLEE
jgi:ubiquinone/menaquinone biosynthesis C-methylase UbiE